MDFERFEEKYSYDEFEKIMKELLNKNKIQENALVRVTLFIDELVAGTKINGLKNSMSAYVYPMGEILPKSGVNVCVSSWTRASDNMIPARAKVNGQYVNASLMKNEALQNGYDEAIALDASGHVSEGTVANLFIIRDDKLITPDMATDILEGITRNSIIEIANELGIEHEQRTIDRTELYIADEAFMCGSSANVTPILSIDKRKVGNGKIGKITKMISDEYSKIQKCENPRFAKWIIKV
jgi:branched-chain amino acid aminotransferase